MTMSYEEMEEVACLAIEALGFYADPSTYYAIGFLPDRPCGEFAEDFSEVDGDVRPGRRARETLAAILDRMPTEVAEDDPCHGPEDTTCPACGMGEERGRSR